MVLKASVLPITSGLAFVLQPWPNESCMCAGGSSGAGHHQPEASAGETHCHHCTWKDAVVPWNDYTREVWAQASKWLSKKWEIPVSINWSSGSVHSKKCKNNVWITHESKLGLLFKHECIHKYLYTSIYRIVTVEQGCLNFGSECCRAAVIEEQDWTPLQLSIRRIWHPVNVLRLHLKPGP